ncbi:hypothetical protein FWC31_04065 [Candidatus Saccharibacteria bacterium]|nr:hypothetical protein [Candidatus Saccharibacteria bacterium]
MIQPEYLVRTDETPTSHEAFLREKAEAEARQRNLAQLGIFMAELEDESFAATAKNETIFAVGTLATAYLAVVNPPLALAQIAPELAA